MLLAGALFALFMVGFWLYCLVDVVLTPSDECRRLPKAAWVAVVAVTFVIGAVAWLAVRSPADPGQLRPA
ncbi:MAG: PLDc N-terminal domain-containing protein [Actinobacteria bacterium]|nr:PLDc N-terminal domain-containing protein [Actinomycetota bacterium]